MDNTYFATLKQSDLLPKLVEKIKDFNMDAERSGKMSRWLKLHKLYFGEHLGETGSRSTAIQYTGSNGELAAFGVNHTRNLIKHVLALATQQKPSYDPRAKNTDIASLQQARLANNILDSYTSEKRLGRHQSQAAERSLVYSSAYLYMTWDQSTGKPYSIEETQSENGDVKEKVVYEGDVSVIAKSPFDVIHDISLKDWSQAQWVVVREYENRWNLAARHPELANDIISASENDDLESKALNLGAQFTNLIDNKERDLIPVYHFYHIRCDAILNGRYVKFINDKVALFDGPIPYTERLPVLRMVPGEKFDCVDGYTDANDIMVLQEAMNVLMSTTFTNQQALAVQAIWMPDGCEISPTQVGKGMVVLKGGPPGSEPKPLQLTNTPPEIFKNMEVIEGAMEKLMGINSVVRGDPSQSLKSGVALARLQAMAIQYISNFQKAWAELLEDSGTFLLQLLRDFAKTERMVALAGRHNKGAMQSFTGDDLNMIERVAVDLGNPIQNTTAGKIEMAESLMSHGAIGAKEYIQVATTGNLDTAIEAPESQKELIRKENEQLMEGKPVKALVGDAHIMHCQEHLTVINDPLLRSKAAEGDPSYQAIVEAVLMHVDEHKSLYQTQEPFYTMLTGEPPAPMPMPPAGMPQDPNAPPPPQMPPPPEQNAPPEAPPVPPIGPDGGLGQQPL
jgi:hypothetical protein